MMAIHGKIQQEGEVVHLVAQQLFDLSADVSGQVHHDYRASTQDIENRISRLSIQLSTLYPILNTVRRACVARALPWNGKSRR
jgi:hypothetical protein